MVLTQQQQETAPSMKVLPKIVGAGSAALVEIGAFHPVDTVAKRLMSNTDNTRSVGQIVFKQAADQPMMSKVTFIILRACMN